VTKATGLLERDQDVARWGHLVATHSRNEQPLEVRKMQARN